MANAMHIYYGRNAKTGEFIISCYHETTQALSNAFQLVGRDKKLLTYKKIELPETYDNSTVKIKLLEYLSVIKTEIERRDAQTSGKGKIIFSADLNLCCVHKTDLAPFLFDKTINHFFPEHEVHLILESNDSPFVLNAIKKADTMNLQNLTLKTKNSVRDAPVFKVYKQAPANKHSDWDEDDETEIDISVPPPNMKGLASKKQLIRTPKEVAKSLTTLGIFPKVEEHGRATGKDVPPMSSPPSSPEIKG
ncbi:hypothetical protein Lnau_0963 [Legionella nautarum]|uniref:Uncharacterized protein n=1 Tax=Legionella nautarum TaxID=45070 RepID=A0A0W0WUI8_9GAMM|nr:hypothetical protein [Legionella nautarum]KTD35979.1 hypothetical protein Lnau_0963 [Legionella nautarum]